MTSYFAARVWTHLKSWYCHHSMHYIRINRYIVFFNFNHMYNTTFIHYKNIYCTWTSAYNDSKMAVKSYSICGTCRHTHVNEMSSCVLQFTIFMFMRSIDPCDSGSSSEGTTAGHNHVSEGSDVPDKNKATISVWVLFYAVFIHVISTVICGLFY